LDKKIQPGFNKLTWTKAQAAEEFIGTCRRHASELQSIVDKYKENLMQCFRYCKKISEHLLVKIDSKKIFENLEFEDDQVKHRKGQSVKLSELYDSIEYTLKTTHEIFKKDDAEDVKREWNKLIDRMHRMLEESFRLNVKNSLLELSKAVNGDGKSAPNPLFKVQVLLESYEENVPVQFGSNDSNNNSSSLIIKYRVNFGPTLDQLAHLVNSIGQYHLTDSISNITKSKHDIFPRNKTPIYLNISRDEDKLKIENQIAAGMENNAKMLEQYLTIWNNFRELWEISKDMFLLRYEQRNPHVSTFDGDIARYTEVENNIQNQETIQTIQFILLDCSPLKYSLLGHCQEWQNKFTSLLLKLATQTLERLMVYFDENTQKVLVPPDTHYDLDTSNKLLESLQNSMSSIEEQFSPLHEQFSVLHKYEVAIPDETTELLKQLPVRWEAYKQTLLDAEEMLKKFKDRFKTKLLQQSEEFKKNVNELVNEFRTKGPFSAEIKPEEALSIIDQMKAKMAKLKEEEQELRRGLGIFRIDHPFSKDIQNLEKDMEALEQVWLVAKAWDDSYGGWKLTVFNTLETRDMDDVAQTEFKKLVKMSRDLREKGWDVVEVTKSKVDRFRRTMPLVNDLHNKAMRERHWNQIKAESNKIFDENGEEFTLEVIIDLHFEENATLINEVSEAASKEFDIEKGLKAINEKWEITNYETSPHKDKGHFKIKSIEDVTKAIEDDQVMLSTYKASRFVKPFLKEVDKWERDISRILEVTDSLMAVQRQWLYLENIFAGEDIRNQLPKETIEFEYLNNSFKTIMVRISKDPNAYRSTHTEGSYLIFVFKIILSIVLKWDRKKMSPARSTSFLTQFNARLKTSFIVFILFFEK
jgi:dynein heavy chain, axonemal